MISIKYSELKYPMVIEIPVDYWVVTSPEGVEVEYNATD